MTRRTQRQPVPPGALEHLSAGDPVLAGIIQRIGPFEPSAEPDLWWSLLDSIAGQQLSAKAAATIVGRIARLGDEGPPGPERMLSIPEESLRACGLSAAKARSVKDLTTKWLDGTLRPDALPDMPDEEVISHLTTVRGIGRWTAEMVLIFTLRRADVLPVDDLGIQNAVQRAYALPQRPKRAELSALGEPWRPYRSVASLYFWRSLSAISLPPPDGSRKS